MKKFFSKVKGVFSAIRQKWKKLTGKIKTPKFVVKLRESKRLQKIKKFLDDYSAITHAVMSLAMCFLMEWLSRHSFVEAVGFVTDHTGAYLYNSFLIYVFYSLAYLTKRRKFVRTLVSVLFLALGIINCIVLLNRVTPFGFTDLSMIGDLFTMQNTNYFTSEQAAAVVVLIVFIVIYLIHLLVKGKKTKPRFKYPIYVVFVLALFISIPFVTRGLQSTGVLTSYFGNLAQGYEDYGYLYGFGTSVFNRGMSKPIDYSEERIAEILEEVDTEDTGEDALTDVNVVVVLLESFCDVSEIEFLETDGDPIPYFHELEANYSTGYLTVPVVGAGTCNTEFEVLTGMSCTFLGPGEYPQKTVLKEIDSLESFASDLSTLGYSSHVVHNNGANFYSRRNAFTVMGFDTFQSKEMLDITEYTPSGSWPTDDILIDATVNAMDSTESADFVYTITVEGHGDYPSTTYEEDEQLVTSCGDKDEALANQWNYYVNRIHNVDEFMQLFIEALAEREEPTLVIFFGDHLPTMGLEEDELESGDLYKTKYVTWNNFGMEKEDQDLTSYQLVSEYLDRLGIHTGTMTSYHQTMIEEGTAAGSISYMRDFKELQYDLMYGERYAYGGEDPYPASNLEMGIADIEIDRTYFYNGKLHIYGDNFTKWSKVYVNGEKVSTTYVSGQHLTIKSSDVSDGDLICVAQVGSSDTILRKSSYYCVWEPSVPEEEEAIEE